MSPRIAAWLGLALWAGCVPKGRHELLEVQLDATRLAMSARAVQSQEDLQALRDQLDDTTLEIVLRQLQLDELVIRLSLQDAEIDRLQAESVALISEIERLQGRVEQLEQALSATRRGREALQATEPPPTIADEALARLQRQIRAQFHVEQETAHLERAHQDVVTAFAPLVEAEHAQILRAPGATVVRIATSRLFQEGWTTPSPRGEQILEATAAALATIPGRQVSIEAHTDDRPLHSAEFPSNWERGFSRAITVLRVLEAAGVPAQLSATSHAGTRPLSPAATDAENRRVELVIRIDPGLINAFESSPGQPPPAAPEPAGGAPEPGGG